MKRTHSHSDKPNAPIDMDIDEAPGPTAKQLEKIINMAREQVKAERKVDKADADLKKAKQELRVINTDKLPKLMKDARMTESPLGDKGAKVVVSTIVTASVPSPYSERVENAAERNRAGIEALDKIAPDLVKNKVTIFFERGDQKFFEKFLRDLNKRKRPVTYEMERTVHSQTLGKFVRDQDALGKGVDEAALGVHRIDITEIILPKKSKDKIKH